MDVSFDSQAIRRKAEAAPSLTRPLLIMMAVTCGLGIANLNYSQPLLAQIAEYFRAAPAQAGRLPMLTQMGFAVGVFFIAPLGDILERRRLILTMLSLVTVSLAAAAFAPSLSWLALASFAIGVTSVLSTLAMPFAVLLSQPEERGATVGTLAASMLIGLLLSRTLSGAAGQAFGWRTMYGIACGLMILLESALAFMLPKSRPEASMSYGALIRSLLDLIRSEPVLRQATLNGMLLYGALNAFWATLAFFLESPAYRCGPAATGAFGLVGAASAMAAPWVGKLADRRDPRVLVGVASVVMLGGYLALWGFGVRLWGLILGIVLLDIAAQSATISNQTSIYGLATDIHSRLYTVYRAGYSLGGALGACLGVLGWSAAGWRGVCLTGGILPIALALAAHRLARRRPALPIAP